MCLAGLGIASCAIPPAGPDGVSSLPAPVVRWLRGLLLRIRPPAGSELDRPIPPEIRDDAFHDALVRVAARPDVRHILEIGASSGAGSTEALLFGTRMNPGQPVIHCIEVSEVRHRQLTARFRGIDRVRCYNLSSVPLESFPSPADVERFWRDERSNLRRIPLGEVLRWLEQDVTYLREHGKSGHGIRQVRREAGVDVFDAVLIDGSEFTGEAELEEVYGARILMLDDTLTYKNLRNRRRLLADPRYQLVEESSRTRNGYAIFQLREG